MTKQPDGQWTALLPQVQHGARIINGWPDVEAVRREWAAIDIWPGDTLAQFVEEYGEHPAMPRG